MVAMPSSLTSLALINLFALNLSAREHVQGSENVQVVVNTSQMLTVTSNHFTCWNIDASRNRGFFDRDLSVQKPYGAQLAKQAREIGIGQEGKHSLLRFGGTGNDWLIYEFGETKCPQSSAGGIECLNQTWWQNLLGFARAAQAKIIFGVCEPKWQGKEKWTPWDPSNTREILQWTIDHGFDDLIFALELGNEVDNIYSGGEQAVNLQVLQNLTIELWKDPSKRPLLLGPDAAHEAPTPNPKPSVRDLYVHDFFEAAGKLGVPIAGATLHKYIQTNEERDLDGNFMDRSMKHFAEYKNTVLSGWKASKTKNSAPRIWGGEVGPHTGGSPPCDHSSMRWANFADSLWYIDSMASAARLGYESYCRQDYIGADYGLVDCATGSPLPDYWSAILWSRLAGPKVLSASAATTSKSLRTYAHCTPKGSYSPGSVTTVLINLLNRTVPASVLLTDRRPDVNLESKSCKLFQFSSSRSPGLNNGTGVSGTEALLNGHTLEWSSNHSTSDLMSLGVSVETASLRLAPESITFLVDTNAGATACLEDVAEEVVLV